MLSLLGGVFLGWSLGSNDAANCYGSAVASRMVHFWTAAVLCAFFVLAGALLEGQAGIETLSGLTSIDPAGARVDLRGKLSYRESAWLMRQAQLSINVDSFVSHLAGALGISQIVLFGSGNAFVVRPDQTKGELVCLVPDYIRDCPGLGPCSASIRDCPAPCTGVHNPKTILRHIKGLEERNMIRPRGEHETASYSFQYVQ